MTKPIRALGMSPIGDYISQSLHELPFVGREQELAWLVAALDPKGHPAGRLRLLSGEPGVGKSRLVAELAGIASDREYRVVWGRCWNAQIAPPYWPWTQVAREILGTRGVQLSEVILGETAAVDRFEIFDAMTELLHDASRRVPLVIIFEDLHQADPASLTLMRFLGEQLRGSQALIIGTFRREDARVRPAISSHVESPDISGLVRDIAPLSLDAVRSLMHDDPVAADVYAVTGGNPLLIEQVGHADGFSAVRSGKPESLFAVTETRIRQLPLATRRALTAVALLGSQPPLSRVAELLNENSTNLTKRLKPAVSAGILALDAESSHDEPTRVRFRHQLFSDAVITSETDEVLKDLHGQAALLFGSERGREAQRADHLLLAGMEHAADAITACREAAAVAFAAGSYEDAVSHLQRAVVAGASISGWSSAEHVRLLIDLGRAYSFVDNHGKAEETFQSAWGIATRENDYEGQGLAALGPRLRFVFTGSSPARRGQVCSQSLHNLPEAPSPLRVKLLATLAIAQIAEAGPLLSQRTAQQALDMTARVDDPIARGYALLATIVTDLGPTTLDARLAAAHEVLAIASTYGERDLAANAHFLLLGGLMEQGNIRGLDSELESRHQLTGQFSELADGRHVGWFRCMRALLDGKAIEAEDLANESFAVAERDGDPDRMIVWVAQIAIVRWLQGRVFETEPIFLEAKRLQPDAPVWTATLAWLWARSARYDAARGAVEQIADLETIPRDRNWMMAMAMLAEVAVILDEADLGERIRDELLPYAERMVPIGLGVACWGTVARPLALLSGAQNRHDEGIAHYRTAINACSQFGAYPWLTEAQLDLAEFLLDHDGDQNEAGRLIAEVLASVKQLKLPHLSERAEELNLRHGAVQPLMSAPPATDAVEQKSAINVLGTFEVVSVSGEIATWSSRKARELLKILVTHHGRPVPKEKLMELLWPDQSLTMLGNRLSVAATAVRRALDPQRDQPTDYHLKSDAATLSLCSERINVDVWSFMAQARSHLVSWDLDGESDLNAVNHTIALYRGDALAEEPYSDWALTIRDEAQSMFCSLSRIQATVAARRGDRLLAVQSCRRILRADPYDVFANEELIAALKILGAYGQAQIAERDYASRMAELDM